MAIERLISQIPEDINSNNRAASFPTFDLGEVLVSADKMRDLLSER